MGGIWRGSEDARLPAVMAFGKDKDSAIKDMPTDYKHWLLGQANVNPYLVEALRGEVA